METELLSSIQSTLCPLPTTTTTHHQLTTISNINTIITASVSLSITAP